MISSFMQYISSKFPNKYHSESLFGINVSSKGALAVIWKTYRPTEQVPIPYNSKMKKVLFTLKRKEVLFFHKNHKLIVQQSYYKNIYILMLRLRNLNLKSTAGLLPLHEKVDGKRDWSPMLGLIHCMQVAKDASRGGGFRWGIQDSEVAVFSRNIKQRF